MKFWNSKKIRKWLRIIHRDLGYFVVGITLVYAVSGILLNHKKNDEDPAYRIVSGGNTIDKNLSVAMFKDFWKKNHTDIRLNKVVSEKDNFKLFLAGGLGDYSPHTGDYHYEIYQKRPMVSFINKLHLNQKHSWTFFGDVFAVSLIFLAVSGLFIVAGKNSFKKRGVWFMLGGIVIVILYVWV